MNPTACSSIDSLGNRPLGRGPALKQLFSRFSDLSTLALGAQEIVRLTNQSPDQQSSDDLDDLQELIQADSSLVALILRRVNSSYYHLDNPVADLTAAAQLLGYREFRNLAMTVYLSRMFEAPMTMGSFSISGLWSHSVAVAAAAQLLSRVCGCAVPTDAYLAGLVHDIGLLIISRQMRRRFLPVLERAHKRSSVVDIERETYSFDHAQLGAHLVREWDFPLPITDAVEYHHDADRYRGEHQELVYVVAVANYFCSRAGWTSLGFHNVTLPPDNAYKLLGLDEVALSIIWKELTGTLEKATFLADA